MLSAQDSKVTAWVQSELEGAKHKLITGRAILCKSSEPKTLKHIRCDPSKREQSSPKPASKPSNLRHTELAKWIKAQNVDWLPLKSKQNDDLFEKKAVKSKKKRKQNKNKKGKNSRISLSALNVIADQWASEVQDRPNPIPESPSKPNTVPQTVLRAPQTPQSPASSPTSSSRRDRQSNPSSPPNYRAAAISTSVAQPVTNPVSHSSSHSAAPSASHSTIHQSATHSATHAATQSASHSASHSTSNSLPQTTSRSISQSASHSAAHPSSHPSSRPSAHPSIQRNYSDYDSMKHVHQQLEDGNRIFHGFDLVQFCAKGMKGSGSGQCQIYLICPTNLILREWTDHLELFHEWLSGFGSCRFLPISMTIDASASDESIQRFVMIQFAEPSAAAEARSRLMAKLKVRMKLVKEHIL